MRADSRPPVVYLRSFEDERHTHEYTLRFQEVNLAYLLKAIGPVVTVAQPGGSEPFLGVRRLSFGEDWQVKVAELVRGASLVVVRTGYTPGLFWEVEEIVKSLAPSKLVLLVDDHEGDYEFFAEKLRHVFPSRLPPLTGKYVGRFVVRGVVFFQADWTASYVPCQNFVGLHHALWRACGHLGMRWRWWKTRAVSFSFPIFMASAFGCTLAFCVSKVASRPVAEMLSTPMNLTLVVAIASLTHLVMNLSKAVKERLAVRTSAR